MSLLVLGLVAAGLALTLRTQRFTPHPSLGPVRAVVAGLAAVGGLLLAVSVGQVWWVIDDRELEETLTTRGTSVAGLATVGLGLLAAVLTVAASRGRRNWAPLVLGVAWISVAFDLYAATGEMHDIDSVGERGPGLGVAAWGVLLITVAAVVGTFARRADLRRAAPAPASGDRPTYP